MRRDEILSALFPGGWSITDRDDALMLGTGTMASGGTVHVVGIEQGKALGVDGAIILAGHVLRIVEEGGRDPLLVMIDTKGQRMSRRDEMLGLNEYLAHLAKTILLASRSGHPTIGLVHGKAAAGAFLATALATDLLLALPQAEPAVMDLPSIARVTKLPEDQLKRMARSTPIFAPGVDPMYGIGAIETILDLDGDLAAQFEEALGRVDGRDMRDETGLERGGRRLAAMISRKVIARVRDAR
ncbi:malonate decarboxylase, gamma subunit [Hartmannibacter diazotrophicus]|uniref:Malonate decarboxylase, gamma subunit n=1 Tax=Hartmannibacter diazotrophicus TaxID=1482074 RepID=A0A2C9D3I7_9HYPH|nr:biotin-independent malonate decarboxylase subunit gamma [Hartmannibacter diazotrophicus]SON54035.1 malonate decarboxylase, gamma subunit [Hartmannibacter diazotrophicus]